MMMYKLPKQSILRKNKEFQHVYQHGRSYANRMMVLYVFPQSKMQSRKVGFAAGKKLGNAVVRNRVKRLLREAYRLNQYQISADHVNLLLVGRKPMTEVKYEVVGKAFINLCIKAKLIK